jgi:methylmalonyl-CoA mutase
VLPTDFDVLTRFDAPTLADWRALVDKDLRGAPFEKRLVTHTYEGIDLQPLYTPADLPESALRAHSGVAPFTRGSRPLGTAPSGWDIRQERAEPDPALLNEALLEDLEGGVQSVLLRLDAASREARDPDDPRASTLIGIDGCSLATPADWRAAFAGVHLGMIAVALEPGAAFLPAAGHLAAMWEAADLKPSDCRGHFNADPLAVLAREGRLSCTLEDGLRRAADLAIWTDARYPNVTAIRVGTAAYHHAGATATQDLAFSMASAIEYLRALTAAGMPLDRAARQLHFSFAVGTSFFLAASKLRAARRLWSRVLEASGIDPADAPMSMHVRPSKRVFTARDPWVNILRNSSCVFAAAVGGADAIGSLPFDAALHRPTGLSRRIARNTHLILQEECGLHRVCDPAGGSYYIDRLTDELAEHAWVILQAIESRGGMARALGSGFIARQIDSAMAPRAKNLATRRDAITGVSEFPLPADLQAAPEPVPFDQHAARDAAIERLKTWRSLRGEPRPADVAAGRPGDLSATAFAMARAGATLAEIDAALPSVGTTALTTLVQLHPFAEPFEHLRAAADRHADLCGQRPRVFLASLGTPAEHTPRTDFARNFFTAGGFEVLSDEGHDAIDDAAAALAASGATLAVLCATDDRYTADATEAAAALHRAGARSLVMAGNPAAREAELRAAGFDKFIFIRCDAVRILSDLLAEEGVTL